MTAKELLAYQLDDANYQLQKILEGASEATLDCRLADKGMSAREQIAHLCECYQAMITESEGGKHNWGTYEVGDTATAPLTAKLFQMRGDAVKAVNSSDDEANMKHAHAFIVAHDYYHIGQMSLIRVQNEPEWDPYSIYR